MLPTRTTKPRINSIKRRLFNFFSGRWATVGMGSSSSSGSGVGAVSWTGISCSSWVTMFGGGFSSTALGGNTDRGKPEGSPGRGR